MRILSCPSSFNVELIYPPKGQKAHIRVTPCFYLECKQAGLLRGVLQFTTYIISGLGTGGTGGTCPPLFKVSDSGHLQVTWLLSLKALKIQKQIEKYTFLAIAEDLRFKKLPGEHAPRTPLTDSQLGLAQYLLFLNMQNAFFFHSRKSAQSHFQKPCQGAPQSMCPHFYNASYVPDTISFSLPVQTLGFTVNQQYFYWEHEGDTLHNMYEIVKKFDVLQKIQHAFHSHI